MNANCRERMCCPCYTEDLKALTVIHCLIAWSAASKLM